MAATSKADTNKKKGQSRVTNQRSLFPRSADGTSIDMRGRWSRRMRDLIGLYSADAGGDDVLSEGERAIIRRIATLQCSLEHLESKFVLADGDTKSDDLIMYQTLANSQRRLIQTIGLKRKPRDVTPDLHTYLNRQTRNGRAGERAS